MRRKALSVSSFSLTVPSSFCIWFQQTISLHVKWMKSSEVFLSTFMLWAGYTWSDIIIVHFVFIRPSAMHGLWTHQATICLLQAMASICDSLTYHNHASKLTLWSEEEVIYFPFKMSKADRSDLQCFAVNRCDVAHETAEKSRSGNIRFSAIKYTIMLFCSTTKS